MHGHFGETAAGRSSATAWRASSSGPPRTRSRPRPGARASTTRNQFLTWHRMYLYYFERVLRQSAGDPTLTLPYWDYATDARLPQAFRDLTYVDETGADRAEPALRRGAPAALNTGTAKLAASDHLVGQRDEGDELRPPSETRLEATPHGSVHCAHRRRRLPERADGRGPGRRRSIRSSTSTTPISTGSTNAGCRSTRRAGCRPTAAILDQRFSFIDGDGSVKQRQVRDMLTTAPARLYLRPGRSRLPAAVTPAAVAGGALGGDRRRGAGGAGRPDGGGTGGADGSDEDAGPDRAEARDHRGAGRDRPDRRSLGDRRRARGRRRRRRGEDRAWSPSRA